LITAGYGSRFKIFYTTISGTITCDGAGNCSVEHPVSTEAACGPEATDCSEKATCDGAGECGEQTHKGTEVQCGADGTECKDKNTCDGAGNCSVENFEPTTVACGDQSSGSCDFANRCDGAGACDDRLVLEGILCDDFTDTDCNKADTCDGAGTCKDNIVAAGVNCGQGDVQCSNQDTCDGAGACANLNHEPDGTQCGFGDACTKVPECKTGACQAGDPVVCNDMSSCTSDVCIDGIGCVFTDIFPVPISCVGPNPCLTLNCNDGNACTADSCDPASGCVNTAIMCDDSNQCTADSCNPASGCVFTSTMDLCNDNNSCTVNDMCDTSGKCVGNSNPACLVIDPSPDNETFDLDYQCENDSEVSITSATFTRDGEPLMPTDLSFYCPPGVILDNLEFGDVPNDFTADVTINGVEGTCVIEEGDDITAISFELVDGEVECFRGMGSDSIIILRDPDDGGVIGVAIGGTFIPIDGILLLVAYAQNNLAWIIPILMISAAIGFMKFGRSKSNENSI